MDYKRKETDITNRSILRKACPTAISSTTNPTRSVWESKQVLGGEMPATNLPIGGMVYFGYKC